MSLFWLGYLSGAFVAFIGGGVGVSIWWHNYQKKCKHDWGQWQETEVVSTYTVFGKVQRWDSMGQERFCSLCGIRELRS